MLLTVAILTFTLLPKNDMFHSIL